MGEAWNEMSNETNEIVKVTSISNFAIEFVVFHTDVDEILLEIHENVSWNS